MAPGPAVTEAVLAPSPPPNTESVLAKADGQGMSPTEQEEEDLGRPANKKVGGADVSQEAGSGGCLVPHALVHLLVCFSFSDKQKPTFALILHS